MTEKNTIDGILDERGARYGEFIDNAIVSQDLKAVMQAHYKWETLSPDKREALEMIAHKIARILNGDSSYIDNFRDIAGYARLVEKTLKP